MKCTKLNSPLFSNDWAERVPLCDGTAAKLLIEEEEGRRGRRRSVSAMRGTGGEYMHFDMLVSLP